MRFYNCIIMILINTGCFAATQVTTVPDVVVKKPSSSNNHSSEKTTITQQDIAAIGASSLSQALQTLGGVQLQDTSGNGSQVLLSMRGFGANASSNTLLMVNGIPLTNPDMAPPDLNAIPVQEIEYIEVFAGSESVLYGDQAVGGIINVVTRHQAKNNLILSCAAGSYDQYNCYAALNNRFKQINYAVGVLSNHTDNYREHNNYDQNLLSGQFEYPYQTGSVAFDYKIVNERMLYPGALTAEQVAEDRRQANNDTDYFKDWNEFYHVRQQQALNANWIMETDLVWREMNGNGVLFSPFTQSRKIGLIKPQVKGNIGQVIFTSGLDAEYDDYNLNTDFGESDDALQKYGIFALLNAPMTSRIWLQIGARGAEQNSQLDTSIDSNTINRAFANTVGVTLGMTSNTSGYLRRAESFRFPKADENATTIPKTDGLKTQRGVAYETGVELNFQPSVTKISVFQLNLRDEITFDPNQTPEDPFGSNRNLDPTVRRGFSVSENYQITDSLSFGGQYIFVNARFQSGNTAGKRIPLVSEHNMHAGINYVFRTFWNLYTETIYTGNQFSANDDANITSPIGGYTVFNSNLSFVYKRFTASFRINNIFNKFYDFYSVFTPSIDLETFYPAPGRNVLFTLKYQDQSI